MSTNEQRNQTTANNQPDWEHVRAQFNLDRDFIHIGASQFIASHPKHVREAIDKYRQHLDRNPAEYTLNNERDYAQDVRISAAKYLGVDEPNNIALTDNTTTGHGLMYTGLNFQPGQEVLFTQHNHYSHQEAMRRATERSGASLREIPLYDTLENVTEEEMVNNIVSQITDKTRMIGITWVHSDSGLKVPVSKVAKEIAKINQDRDENTRVLLLVDGVHGFGIETETFPELGCDYFLASGHKWLYGPRGTGFIVATTDAWQHVSPVIPSFEIMIDVIEKDKHPAKMDGKEMTPGGYLTFEHRWALRDAFEFAEGIGKQAIYDRVHQLNRRLKEGLASMSHIQLHTPIDDRLSAGITAFDVKGMRSQDVVDRLLEKKIIATVAPYRSEFARCTPGIYNTPEEVDLVLEAIQSLRS